MHRVVFLQRDYFLGNLYVFLNPEKDQLGKKGKRIRIPLLELNLNNHHRDATSLKK